MRVLRHLAEVVYQNTLDIIIPPRVAVLDTDQLKAVLAADLVLLAVTALDGMKPIFKYFVPGAILFIYIYGMVTFHWR